MSRTTKIWISVIVFFVLVNIVLLANDHSNRVDRVTFISDWTAAEQKDMQDTLAKDGVLDYAKEHFIYFDDALGSFNEFLVEEGDVVRAGEDVYSYDVHHFYDMQMKLEQKSNELTETIQAINTAIQKIERSPITQEEFRFVYPDNSEAGTLKQNVSDATMLKEQYLADKEKELAEKQAALESVEAQLSELRSGSETITVQSPYEGKVAEVETSLNNPLITIQAPELFVTGELSESERMQVEMGMHADIQLNDEEEPFQGSVSDMDEEPIELALNKTSIYPFYVQFEEEMTDDNQLIGEESDFEEERGFSTDEAMTEEELLQGYHADVTIILEDHPEAVVLPEKLIEDEKVWVMARDGELMHVPVSTGIEQHGYVEIEDDVLEEGDWIALKPKAQFRENSQFITPFKPSESNWRAIFKDGARKRSVLIGLLGR